MSLEITNRFLKAFNSLDDILKDMYPDSVPSKLGVTRYLEDMREREYSGALKISSWKSDFQRLRELRNMRNSAVHDNMLDADLFSEDDIAYINAFKNRVINSHDPISLLTTSSGGSHLKKSSIAPLRSEKGSIAFRLIGVFSFVIVILVLFIVFSIINK